MWKSLILIALLATVAGADPKVTVRSATDNSHTTTNEAERKHIEEFVRNTIVRLIGRAPITLDGNRTVDANVISLTTDGTGTNLTVTSVIRVVVSDDQGRITAVFDGGATAERLQGNRSSIAQLRDEALAGSLDGIYRKVKTRLHAQP